MTKEQKRISRREFFIGTGLTAIAAGCKRVEKKLSVVAMELTPIPTEKPTERPPATEVPTKKPTEKPTIIPEPTPTKEEILRIPDVTITEELLTKAFEGIGGGEIIEPSLFGTPTPESSKEKEKPMSFTDFIEGEYFQDAWEETSSLQKLTKDPLISLKCMVALGTYAGAEGSYSPGGASGNEVFPYLFEKGVHFLRRQIPEVPSEQEQQTAEVQEGVMPNDLVLRPDTYLMVMGKFKGELISPALEKMEYALVASTDWFRKYIRGEESMAPFHYWGIVPVSLPDDPENKKAFTLENLLAKAGVKYDKETGEAHFTNKEGKKVIEGINEFEGEELVQKIKEDAGIWFVDQMKGEVLANPIVPHPPEDFRLPEDNKDFYPCPVSQEYCMKVEEFAHRLGFCLPEGTEIKAVMPGDVYLLRNNFGDVIIELRSSSGSAVFYTLPSMDCLNLPENIYQKHVDSGFILARSGGLTKGSLKYNLSISCVDDASNYYSNPRELFGLSKEIELPKYWEAQRKEEDGEVFISIEGGESMEEEFKEIAQARYDEEKREWKWKKIESELALEPGEILISKDLIALPEEKILELLSLPENEGKIICPVNVDEETEVKIATREEENGSISDAILITNFKEDNPEQRILFHPSNLGVESHVAPRDYGRDAYFELANGLVIKVVNPDDISITTSKTQERVKFGQILATGFKNIPANKRYEESVVAIWIADPNNPRRPLKASEFMLRYKDRWVVAKK